MKAVVDDSIVRDRAAEVIGITQADHSARLDHRTLRVDVLRQVWRNLAKSRRQSLTQPVTWPTLVELVVFKGKWPNEKKLCSS